MYKVHFEKKIEHKKRRKFLTSWEPSSRYFIENFDHQFTGSDLLKKAIEDYPEGEYRKVSVEGTSVKIILEWDPMKII